MSGRSKIEWTEVTWNPVVGCSVLTPGCTNCYAMKMAHRIELMATASKGGLGGHYAGTTRVVNGKPVWTGKLALAPEHVLLAPLKRKKPSVYFVNSMSDLFHEDCPDEWVDHVFAVMALSPQHTFQVLTKRAERMRQWFAGDRADSVGLAMLTIVDRIPHGHRRVPWPLPNVWLGVSAERQQEADERIPTLIRTPAAVRFVSCEPLLGPIDLTVPNIAMGCGKYGFPDLHWIIAGGESGPGARPMHPHWARSLRDQCAAAGVSYFFKQWGEWIPSTELRYPLNYPHLTILPDGRAQEDEEKFPGDRLVHDDMRIMCRVGKKAAGRLLDRREHNAMPQVRA
jgi:protein gp37